MALTTWVVYRDVDGSIVRSFDGEESPPPYVGAGQSCKNVGLLTAKPSRKTHVIVGGALTPRDQGDVDAENAAERREELRRSIATLEAVKDKYQTEGPPWDTTALDVDIDRLRAEHDALP
jgi:hypothetical protein